MRPLIVPANQVERNCWIEAQIGTDKPTWEWRKAVEIKNVSGTVTFLLDTGKLWAIPSFQEVITFDEYPEGVVNRHDVPDWDDYFLGLAKSASVRAKCRRRKVGAILVGPDNHISSTGYNGHPVSGSERDCLSGGCPRGLMSKTVVSPYSSYDSGPGICIAAHAEANAVARRKERVENCTIYVTDKPCFSCTKTIMANGVIRAVWLTGISTSDPLDFESMSVHDLFNEYLSEAVNKR